MKRLIYFLLCISLSVSGQNNLNDYLELAGKQNPEIQAAFYQYSAAMEKVPQVSSLPDLQSSLGVFLQPMELLGGNQVASVQLMQMFPWFGTLTASKNEAALMAKAKFEAFNSVKSSVFYQVKASWYQLVKYDKEIALVDENISLLESLEKIALVKFQSPVSSGSSNAAMSGSGSSMKSGATNSMSGMNGSPTQPIKQKVDNSSAGNEMSTGMNTATGGLQNVLRIRMEILEQKNRVAQLKDQRKTEESSFNALLNRNLNIPVEISQELEMKLLPSDRLALSDSILARNPMLAMVQRETESYTYMEQKAKKMGLPMIGLGVNYMVIEPRTGNTAMMNGNDMIMPMVSVSIPIYRKKYTAMQNEAKYMRQAGIEQAAGMKNNLLVQYQQILLQIDNAARNVTLYKEQENLARKTTELLLTDFSTTGTNFEETLRMQMKVLDYSFKHIEAIIDNNTAVANIEMLLNYQKTH